MNMLRPVTDGMQDWMAAMMAFGALTAVVLVAALTLLAIVLFLQSRAGAGQPG
jgi:hypothetical protein